MLPSAASPVRWGALSGSPGETPETWAEPLDRRVFGALVELSAEVPGFLAELSEEFQKGRGRPGRRTARRVPRREHASADVRGA
jgi:hypothetical protein